MSSAAFIAQRLKMGYAINSNGDDDKNNDLFVPQHHIHSQYQSSTEKGIRHLCSKLLEMKRASSDDLYFNVPSKYSAFVSVSQELLSLQNELTHLKNHIFTQKDLVDDIKHASFFKVLKETISDISDDAQSFEKETSSHQEDLPSDELEIRVTNLEEDLDVLLAEHKIEEALSKLDSEEKAFIEFQKHRDLSSSALFLYHSALTERKEILAKQLAEVAEQPVISASELQKALQGLLSLGYGDWALELLLRFHRARILYNVQNLIPSSAFYSETYGVNLAQMTFSVISQAVKDVRGMFGETSEYLEELMLWSQKQIRRFVKLLNKYFASIEDITGLRAATSCVQASVFLSATLEEHGLFLYPNVLELMQPFWEGTLEASVKKLEEEIYSLAATEDWVLSLAVDQLSTEKNSMFDQQIKLTHSAYKFSLMIQEFMECMTPNISAHYGESILNGLACLFDHYIDVCMRAIPCPSEEENNPDIRDIVNVPMAETESQQLAVFGNASALSDLIIPFSIGKVFNPVESETDDVNVAMDIQEEQKMSTLELKDFRRHLQRAVDTLRDHFCRQYVLGLIYCREGNVQLTGGSYLNGKSEDLFWDPNAMPSLFFQELYTKLNQFSHIAAAVLVGREKVAKQLLTRLVETLIIWLSDDQDFWEVIEDEAASLTPFGLQQFILDMHFLSQIANGEGYSSKHINQSVSTIINRAITVFSERGIDPDSALPEDEWFIDTASEAINKLCNKGPNGDSDEPLFTRGEVATDILDEDDNENLTDQHGHVQKVRETREIDSISTEELNGECPDSPCSMVSAESFASAEMEREESSEDESSKIVHKHLFQYNCAEKQCNN